MAKAVDSDSMEVKDTRWSKPKSKKPERKREASSEERKPDIKTEEVAAWTSAGQLTLFRQQASQIADDFLKAQKIKVLSGGSRRGNQRDSQVRPGLSCVRRDTHAATQAYGIGQQDSKRIDIKQRKIE
jgi:hypothetical protein